MLSNREQSFLATAGALKRVTSYSVAAGSRLPEGSQYIVYMTWDRFLHVVPNSLLEHGTSIEISTVMSLSFIHQPGHPDHAMTTIKEHPRSTIALLVSPAQLTSLFV